MALRLEKQWRAVVGSQDDARESKKAGVQEGSPNNVNHSTATLFSHRNTLCPTLFLNTLVN